MDRYSFQQHTTGACVGVWLELDKGGGGPRRQAILAERVATIIININYYNYIASIARSGGRMQMKKMKHV